ncbi:MAG: hypothetical protein ACXWPM_02125 [Bdellovibrionota bacterium]
MRLWRRSALIWGFLIGIANFAVSGGEARASELSLMLRIQRDYYAPPTITKNFHPCFKIDPRGMQILSFCAEADVPARAPAAVTPSPRPPASPKRPAVQSKKNK